MAASVAAVNEQIISVQNYNYVQDDRINNLTYDINEKITKIAANQLLVCDKLQANCK